MADSEKTFTGRSRQRKTTLAVRLTDWAARSLITIGGIGTIASVLMVSLFLVWTVLPLFGSASLEDPHQIPVEVSLGDAHFFRVDENRAIGYAIDREGTLSTFRLDTGETLVAEPAFETDAELLDLTVVPNPAGEGERQDITVTDRQAVAAAFDDGTVAFGEMAIKSDFLDPKDVPEDFLTMGEGEQRAFEYDGRKGIVRLTPSADDGSRMLFRMQSVVWKPQKPFDLAESPVRSVDVIVDPLSGPVFAAVVDGEEGGYLLRVVSTRLKGLIRKSLAVDESYDLPFENPTGEPPMFVAFASRPDKLFLGWADGRLLRYDTRRLADAELAEEIDVTEGDARLTVFRMMLGRETLVFGDSNGRISGWFVVRPEGRSFLPNAVKVPATVTVTTDGLVLPREAFPKLPEEAYFPEDGLVVPADRFEIADLEANPVEPTDEGVTISGKRVTISNEGVGIPPEGIDTSDSAKLIEAHAFPPGPAAVTGLGISSRTRSFLAGFEDGTFRAGLMTTGETFYASSEAISKSPLRTIGIGPKDDALFAATESGLWAADFERGHPEITWTSLFRPVHYEGYEQPTHVWQSSGGSQELEPKYGMWPLVYGTLKATFYSLLFGVPLALFAAIYSSEFLHPQTKGRVKPTIEIMASLPSVVLGFLAGLVFAPVVERLLPSVLAAFVTVPLAFVVGAQLMQLTPDTLSRRLEKVRLPLALFVALPAGLWAAWAVGPSLETLVFAGDVKLWLDGQKGNGVGAWMILLLPLTLFVVSTISTRVLLPSMLSVSRDWPRGAFALLELGRFLAVAALVLVGAYVLSWGLDAAGWDPRGTYVDTYIQKNSLVVGFVMGFAIIPIIYTIADDALSAVPDSLRAASLGAGATPWQTAVRIVIPTATSGLFSAIMVGLGRAVGETMIVLMAAGNTPIMEMNVFNGFRTLSANIAVELPEAPKGGTHFRTLFLAALVLFLLTFLVNTLAEFVRLRFRRRVVQL